MDNNRPYNYTILGFLFPSAGQNSRLKWHGSCMYVRDIGPISSLVMVLICWATWDSSCTPGFSSLKLCIFASFFFLSWPVCHPLGTMWICLQVISRIQALTLLMSAGSSHCLVFSVLLFCFIFPSPIVSKLTFISPSPPHQMLWICRESLHDFPWRNVGRCHPR